MSDEVFRWSKELETGIASIDEQHKKLFSIANDFYIAMKEGKGREKIKEVVKELLDYSRYHFATEEKYFKKYNYPEFESHKKEHDFFVKKVEEIYNELKEGKTISVTIATYNFLVNWVKNHIMGTDMKYKDFLLSRGVK